MNELEFQERIWEIVSETYGDKVDGKTVFTIGALHPDLERKIRQSVGHTLTIESNGHNVPDLMDHVFMESGMRPDITFAIGLMSEPKEYADLLKYLSMQKTHVIVDFAWNGEDLERKELRRQLFYECSFYRAGEIMCIIDEERHRIVYWCSGNFYGA